MAHHRGQSVSKRVKSQHSQSRNLKRKREIEDIESLSQHVANLDPKVPSPSELFSTLPLSQSTLSGLEASHFKKLTPIQARAIPASLKGCDILGSAKTGSGKTLAFIVPILENLFRKRWTEHDGLGALILSPTRELAVQIFDVLRKVGRNHSFSAGLVIGGRSLQEERDRLGRINILIATPGRMLQHMDQNADLDVGNLQMLVLDEADRIMDMGFQSTVDAIVEHLPKDRQTLLFSATQTRKVSDLARLSLQDPEFVSVEEESDNATPTQLSQNFVVTPLPQKLDTLWSFIRSNTKKKILVFLSSGKQVRFVYEGFRHLQPGISLLHLHGRQKQSARMGITAKFSNSKYACLFSTDVAARGLDFPAVDWVVQLDCPEDADTYIHRVGRTARYNSSGHAVLLLDPSERQGMLDALERKKVVGVEEIHVKEKKMQNTIQNQLQDMCFKDPELKYLGQKAFISYVRSVFVQKDKNIFDVKQLDLEAFAASLGLPGAPRVKFVKGEDIKRLKNMPRALAAMENGDSEDDDETRSGKPKEKQVRTKYDRMFERRNQDVLTEHYAKLINDGNMNVNEDSETAEADDDDFMAVKRRYDVDDARLGQNSDRSSPSSSESETNSDDQATTTGLVEPKPKPKTGMTTTTTKKVVHLSNNPNEKPLIVDSKRREKLAQSKKALLKYKGHGAHTVFDSDDEDDNLGHERVYYEKEEDFQKRGDAQIQRERFLKTEKEHAQRADEVDREIARQKKRDKKIRMKEREREELADLEGGDDDDENGGGFAGVQLAPYNEDENEGNIAPSYLEDDDEDEDETEPKKKKKRRQFEDSDDQGNGKMRLDDHTKKSKSKTRKSRNYNNDNEDDKRGEPQTLEDLEALAMGLLAS